MIRETFRNEVFKRDKYTCVCCEFKSNSEKCRDELDAHHVQDRNLFAFGGYVKGNGITVCKFCHEICELFHQGKECPPDFMPDALYLLINSSFEEALKQDEKNCQ